MSGSQIDMESGQGRSENLTPGGSSARAHAQKSGSKTWILFVVLILVALAGLVAYGALPRMAQKQALDEHTKQQLTQAFPVSVIAAQPGPEVQEFTLPGATQAIQDAPIYARVNGYLRTRNVNIGDLVHKGEVLAEIDTPELDQQVQGAMSSVEQATANLDNAKEAYEKTTSDARTAAANVQKAKTDLQFYARELGRYKELVSEGAVSQEDTDGRFQAYNGGIATRDALIAAEKSAQSSVNAAKAAVHVAEAALNTSKATLHQYEATRSFRTVVAPFDGIVIKRNVDAGALITSGSNSGTNLLFEVAKTDVLRVFVYVPEQFVPFIHVGEQAKLVFQEHPRQDFIGTVANVSGGIDPESKTLQVEIHVPNTKNLLLPGMYASVRFQSPVAVRLPKIPATTVQTRADGCFVYTVDKKNVVHLHKVEIGRDLGGYFEIARGISSGDIVVVSPPDSVHEGLTVTPVEAADKDKTAASKS
ncbi:MAG: efflux RND transporter periplasmic adaptor subunit [Candidatus Obscuribacterales bacterium]|nr:efflux RND transporter periplasmic adaptor subunit [Candidatus Obscuribacterales bacterium]